ncbi:DUF2071 domain-containing protein [bacterium]|nr:DUF2071 domain-containing protein [bacterium]
MHPNQEQQSGPSLEQRLAPRQRPAGRAFMRNRWERLLFAHWEYPAGEIQYRLPHGLHLDTYDGRAYIGVVPFLMRRVTLAGWPAIPGFSDFLELNVRTYVHDSHGRPGVWFFSLDCNQPLAVLGARSLYNLPYEHASMRAALLDGTQLHTYQCRRRGRSSARSLGIETRRPYGRAQFTWPIPSGKPEPLLQEAEPGSLEFFLAERYLLFAFDYRRGRLFSGAVHHAPYRVAPVKAAVWDEQPLVWNGFDPPGRPPDHCMLADSVDVEIFKLQPLA